MPMGNWTNCLDFLNNSDPSTHAFFHSQVDELTHIYRVYHGWMQSPFGVVGLLMSSIYSLACYQAIKQRRVSRKSYVLLLNRSCGDVFTCLMTFVVFGYVHAVEIPNRDYVQVIDSILMGCFWSSMTSYVALSVLKLYAVARPLAYRNNVTIRRCVHLIVLSWMVFLVMVAYAMTAIALSKVPPLMEWSGCKVETCLRVFYRLRNACMCLVYGVTMVVFTLTVVLIRRHQRFPRIHSHKSSANSQLKTNSTKRKLQDRFPLWKLAVNVATFAFFNVFYVAWAGGLLLFANQCFFVVHFNRMIMLLSFVHLSIMTRVVLDPVIAFITDTPIRRAMLSVVGWSGRFGLQQNANEDNSSESNQPKTSVTTIKSRPSTIRSRVIELA